MIWAYGITHEAGALARGCGGPTDLKRCCVSPYYLRMMGVNALNYDVPFSALRDVARETPTAKSLSCWVRAGGPASWGPGSRPAVPGALGLRC